MMWKKNSKIPEKRAWFVVGYVFQWEMGVQYPTVSAVVSAFIVECDSQTINIFCHNITTRIWFVFFSDFISLAVSHFWNLFAFIPRTGIINQNEKTLFQNINRFFFCIKLNFYFINWIIMKFNFFYDILSERRSHHSVASVDLTNITKRYKHLIIIIDSGYETKAQCRMRDRWHTDCDLPQT